MQISPKTTKIGWIGTGVMGRWMCQHCLNSGYAVTVYNRSPEKAASLVEQGAVLAGTPAEVASQSDVVFTIVGFPHDVESVILGEQGVLSTLKPGGVVVDMTTSEPGLAKTIAEQAKQKQVHVLDAPVSGGDVGAQNATLTIMVGGDEATFKALEPLWATLGKNWTYLGEAGSGQNTKMVNQIAISSGMIAMVEALLYAKRAGLPIEDVVKVISGGAAGSWSLTNYAPRIIKGDYAPGFYVAHFVKDLGIALREAEKMQLTLPGLTLAHGLYDKLAQSGFGDYGTQALMLALEAMQQEQA